MDTRSKIAIVTLLVVLGVMYFGRGLPSGRAELGSSHPHDAATCERCHSFAGDADEIAAALRRDEACLSCHSANESKTTEFGVFHSDRAEDCTRCHSFHKPNLITIGDDSTLLSIIDDEKAICLDCHATSVLPEVSPGHREAAKFAHSQSTTDFARNPSAFCLACHGADQTQLPAVMAELKAPRFHLSASHAFGLRLQAGHRRPNSTLKIQDEIPLQLTLIDGKIECQTCHSLVSTHDSELVQTIEDGLCTGCHEMQPNPTFVVSPDATP